MQRRSTKDLRVAQLVEHKTVKVALYLEVACLSQALEIHFANCLLFIFLFFHPTGFSYREQSCSSGKEPTLPESSASLSIFEMLWERGEGDSCC